MFSVTGKGAFTGFSKLKRELDELMRAALGEQFRPFVLHDVRRGVQTGLSALAISPDICELILGHSLGGLRRVYDQHSYAAEKRDALERWERRLLSIVAPPPDNVIALEPARVR